MAEQSLYTLEEFLEAFLNIYHPLVNPDISIPYMHDILQNEYENFWTTNHLNNAAVVREADNNIWLAVSGFGMNGVPPNRNAVRSRSFEVFRSLFDTFSRFGRSNVPRSRIGPTRIRRNRGGEHYRSSIFRNRANRIRRRLRSAVLGRDVERTRASAVPAARVGEPANLLQLRADERIGQTSSHIVDGTETDAEADLYLQLVRRARIGRIGRYCRYGLSENGEYVLLTDLNNTDAQLNSNPIEHDSTEPHNTEHTDEDHQSIEYSSFVATGNVRVVREIYDNTATGNVSDASFDSHRERNAVCRCCRDICPETYDSHSESATIVHFGISNCTHGEGNCTECHYCRRPRSAAVGGHNDPNSATHTPRNATSETYDTYGTMSLSSWRVATMASACENSVRDHNGCDSESPSLRNMTNNSHIVAQEANPVSMAVPVNSMSSASACGTDRSDSYTVLDTSVREQRSRSNSTTLSNSASCHKRGSTRKGQCKSIIPESTRRTGGKRLRKNKSSSKYSRSQKSMSYDSSSSDEESRINSNKRSRNSRSLTRSAKRAKSLRENRHNGNNSAHKNIRDSSSQSYHSHGENKENCTTMETRESSSCDSDNNSNRSKSIRRSTTRCTSVSSHSNRCRSSHSSCRRLSRCRSLSSSRSLTTRISHSSHRSLCSRRDISSPRALSSTRSHGSCRSLSNDEDAIRRSITTHPRSYSLESNGRSRSNTSSSSMCSGEPLSSHRSLAARGSQSSWRSLSSGRKSSSSCVMSLSSRRSLSTRRSLSSHRSLSSSGGLSTSRSVGSCRTLSNDEDSISSSSLSSVISLSSRKSLSTRRSLSSHRSLSSCRDISSTRGLSTGRSGGSCGSLSNYEDSTTGSITTHPRSYSLESNGSSSSTTSSSSMCSGEPLCHHRSLRKRKSQSSCRSLNSRRSLSSRRSLTTRRSQSRCRSLSQDEDAVPKSNTTHRSSCCVEINGRSRSKSSDPSDSSDKTLVSQRTVGKRRFQSGRRSGVSHSSSSSSLDSIIPRCTTDRRKRNIRSTVNGNQTSIASGKSFSSQGCICRHRSRSITSSVHSPRSCASVSTHKCAVGCGSNSSGESSCSNHKSDSTPRSPHGANSDSITSYAWRRSSGSSSSCVSKRAQCSSCRSPESDSSASRIHSCRRSNNGSKIWRCGGESSHSGSDCNCSNNTRRKLISAIAEGNGCGGCSSESSASNKTITGSENSFTSKFRSTQSNASNASSSSLRCCEGSSIILKTGRSSSKESASQSCCRIARKRAHSSSTISSRSSPISDCRPREELCAKRARRCSKEGCYSDD